MLRVFCESVNIPPPNLRERPARLSRIIFVGSFFGLALFVVALLLRCKFANGTVLDYFFFFKRLDFDFFGFAEERNSKNNYNDE